MAAQQYLFGLGQDKQAVSLDTKCGHPLSLKHVLEKIKEQTNQPVNEYIGPTSLIEVKQIVINAPLVILTPLQIFKPKAPFLQNLI